MRRDNPRCDHPPHVPGPTVVALAARLSRSPSSITKLDANENLLGPSPSAILALADPLLGRGSGCYPDPDCRELRSALARFCGVPADTLLVGNGSIELIAWLLDAVVEPGDAVLTCSPTFVQFAALTEIRGGRVVDIARREDFSLDVDAIRRAVAEHRPKLLMLASPNTPDGSRLPDEVTDLLLSLPVLVLLDEAYVEYSDPNGLGAAHTRFRQVLELDNLVTLRTFSKWAGLAGLRIGYGAFPERLRRAVVRRRLPFSVNAMAQAAAVASLVDVEDPRTKVRRITVERERLRGELARIPGFSPFPSCANFVLTRIDERIAGRSAAELARELEEAGVLVRHCAAETLPDCLRITSGRAQDTDALLDALRRILRIAG